MTCVGTVAASTSPYSQEVGQHAHLRTESARYIGVLAEGGVPPIEARMPATLGRHPPTA